MIYNIEPNDSEPEYEGEIVPSHKARVQCPNCSNDVDIVGNISLRYQFDMDGGQIITDFTSITQHTCDAP